jgi:hypothetical protein
MVINLNIGFMIPIILTDGLQIRDQYCLFLCLLFFEQKTSSINAMNKASNLGIRGYSFKNKMLNP